MPIYAYRCDDCGFAKDVLQKISDPQLTVCLSCGKPTFTKQLTAAGFQLKGTGWYVTDFRGGNAAPTSAAPTGPVETAAGKEAAAAAGAPAASAAPAAAASSAASSAAGGST